MWLRTATHRRGITASASERRLQIVSHFPAKEILAIFRRTNSTDITKDLRKVLLGLEAAGHGDV